MNVDIITKLRTPLNIGKNITIGFAGKPIPADLSALSGKYDTIVAANIFWNSYAPADIFAELAKHLTGNGVLILSETIVDNNADTWLNTLATTADEHHARFLRPEEIIDSAASHFCLKEFIADESAYSYIVPTDKASNIANQIKALPSVVIADFSDNTLKLNVTVGTFFWQLNGE